MSRRRGSHSRRTQSIDDYNRYKTSTEFGSHLNTLTEKEKAEIDAGVQHILSEIGFEQLPKFLECLVDNKTIIKKTLL